MKYKLQCRIAVIGMGLLLVAGSVSADVLELKDGTVLNGQYKGGTQGTLRFQVGGQIRVVAVKDIMALSFTGGSAASAPVSAAPEKVMASKSTKPAKKGPKTVAAGTTLLVRTDEEIGTHNKKAGQ